MTNGKTKSKLAFAGVTDRPRSQIGGEREKQREKKRDQNLMRNP